MDVVVTPTGRLVVRPSPPVTTMLVEPAWFGVTAMVLPETLIETVVGSPPDAVAMNVPV